MCYVGSALIHLGFRFQHKESEGQRIHLRTHIMATDSRVSHSKNDAVTCCLSCCGLVYNLCSFIPLSVCESFDIRRKLVSNPGQSFHLSLLCVRKSSVLKLLFLIFHTDLIVLTHISDRYITTLAHFKCPLPKLDRTASIFLIPYKGVSKYDFHIAHGCVVTGFM